MDITSELLPISSWLKPALLIHIHLHVKVQKRYGAKASSPVTNKVIKHALLAMIQHLESAVVAMNWLPEGTEYYEDTNYSQEAMNNKQRLVEEYLSESNPSTVWDMGANTGVFSRIATAKNIDTAYCQDNIMH